MNMPGSREKQKIERCDRVTSISASIKSVWNTRVAMDFFDDHGRRIDHLSNERTWHNWLALSNAASWMGIVVAQMSKVSKVVRPDHYHMLRYKACICQAISIVILLIGTYRFFREQSAINESGKRTSQGTLLAAGVLVLILACSFFVVMIVADTDIIQ